MRFFGGRLLVWKTYGKSTKINESHKVFHHWLRKGYGKPKGDFFLLWETQAKVIAAMVHMARQ